MNNEIKEKMNRNASFKVDPKLAELLGETYKSTEDAIKELVDNSFDADAEEVWITLPNEFSEEQFVTIVDNGTGMKEMEVRTEYLKIASSRASRKGTRTYLKNRVVKGRKGIGKFSGLMVAEIMEIKTIAGGKETILTIIKEELAKAKYDLEKVKLPTVVTECSKNEHGTTITLKGLNDNFEFPNAEKLKEILVWEFGREQDFTIWVNDEKIGILDFQGKSFEKVITLENNKKAILRYAICDKPIRKAGILYRVGSKIVGRPENFLKDDEIIPDKLKKRIVGEIICDDLEDYVTADWGAIIENSKLNEEIRQNVKKEVSDSLNEVFKTDMHLARLRYQQRIDKELQKLPEYKRFYAEKALQKILEKFYEESDDKINTVISVMVDAMEKDYYWSIIDNIESSRDGDIEKFADALSEFGFLEMSIVSNQAISRSKFLDELDFLRSRPETLEATIHKALEKNLWVLGSEYTLISSNKSLSTTLRDYLDTKYSGKSAKNRPDLFLGGGIARKNLLIEFKRPAATIGRDDEAQALKYRDELSSYIHDKKIEIMVIGGKVASNISSHYERDDLKLCTYTDIISEARGQYEWLLKELNNESK